ncbi:hypothetical protein [Cellulomonas fimi]|uniref:ABC3 transporter permease protein domain-containing protein n=1 Tax=Cellulomonas fimi (strain ATCC 484 / DSM 20113 / JCM 1341 / CCUG 24087 / LMG 16345 / NBRC 15513 / NCIMB 8980 / NCTC 7547 / NRS-133) TaxID=590998 RepID=F4GZ36_CELFA|nr:hypothetical protein [Cellulomonas fimi]AEE46026.1 protein of unknown function DUF214 [Cellulomonas fimi ATCC 484]NNH06878.1 hypothetical protein [Cellulomonas fimi]VEH31342.1 FtsX-like permease family [Cellulomonas fimi]
MRELVWRRARAQTGVLAAVLAVLVVGSSLVGVCVLLTTAAPQRALQLAVARVPASDVEVGVALGFPEDPDDPDVDPRVAATSHDPAAAVATATALLTEPFGDLPTTTTTWTSSVVRYLPPDGGPVRLGYLAELDDPDARGTVVTGRWPDASGEVALPDAAARALGLGVGSTTSLAADAGGPGTALTVVGTFTPVPAPAWREDPLGGAGVGPDFRGHVAAYGPFVVPAGEIAAGAVPVGRVRVVVQPDLARADPTDLVRAGTLVDALRADLDEALQDRAQNVVVDRPFADTLAAAREQGRVTTSGVLAVALLGCALAATAVTLAARLVAGRRGPESALLAARGVGRGRLVAQAAVEASALAVLSAVPATALALALYRVLADAVGLGTALPRGALVPLVGSVLAVTVVLGSLLVLPWLRPATTRAAREDRTGVVARSGADLLLLALAVLAFLQLRAHRVATGGVVDPVLVAAPVVCLLAGAVLALRPLALVARRLDARAGAARSLTLPLAAWAVARRRQGGAAAFLLVLATACAAFGSGFAATWTQSQADQAAAAVGADVTLAAPPDALGAGAVLRDVTGGQVSPVTSRPTVLGSRAISGEPVQLVAVDTRDASRLLRGRAPAGGWDQATAGLAPATPAGGVQLSGTRVRVVVTGHVDDGVPVWAALGVVVQDGDGAREALPVGTIALDGTPLTQDVVVPPDARVVGVDAQLSADGDVTQPERQRSLRFGIELVLHGASTVPGAWSVGRPSGDDVVAATLDRVTTSDAPDGAHLTLDGTAALPDLQWSDGPVAAFGFDPVEEVPVLVSADLSDDLGISVGDGVQLTLGLTRVPATVTGVVPYVPSQPRSPAVLADVDTLSRATLGQGDVAPVTDAWWATGGLRAGADATLAARGFGPATERTVVAHEAVEGPSRAAQRAATALLVLAAVVLALAGTALHAASALDARELDVARLHGMGAPRRSVRASLLAEQGVLTGAPVLLGALLGALACWAVGPLLAVSADGLPPVPAAVPLWPWPVETAVVAVLLLGCAAVVVPLADRAVRRSTVSRLRTDPLS